jgi:serine/threonine protein kinase
MIAIRRRSPLSLYLGVPVWSPNAFALNWHTSMPLTMGARIGPYEIQAPIGAGGIGEVYRARDTRLGREVALRMPMCAFTKFHDFTNTVTVGVRGRDGARRRDGLRYSQSVK